MRIRVFKMILILCCICSMVACGQRSAKTPEQWFEFTWSGLAGRDALTFQGDAALLRGDKSSLEDSMTYYGELKNHRELNMVTVLPHGNKIGTWQMAGTGKGNQFAANLLWEGGSWTPTTNQGDALSLGMTRLNPLDQLENIRRMNKKKITAESGAARGTEVLRIELDPSEAKDMIGGKLIDEMQEVRVGLQNKLAEIEPGRRSTIEKEVMDLWSSGNGQLVQMLEQAEARVIYHLTIDRRSGLPQRLTSESELNYRSHAGLLQRELLLTDNRFVKYQ
ncbi:hypothetical protein [Paenibacillus anaericanus]|uniref:hypothetical protein n=1 Tax=Paenibacillus anaericanus TaxID=170367 RepID=UPI0027D79211|nr:hypothetical protein [Paenibacillus anaericanus]